MKTIYCDIDSTLSNHWVRIRRNTIGGWPGTYINSKAFTREEVLQDELLLNANAILWTLKDTGWDITYLSARGWPNAEAITQEQLKGWRLPNSTKIILCANIREKVGILKRDLPAYFIDDFMTGQENNIGTFQSGIAQAVQFVGIRVIIFRNDWRDVYDQIMHFERMKK